MNERNCSSCDTPVPADAAFCPNCGVATPTDLNIDFGEDLAGGEQPTETGIAIGTPQPMRFKTTRHMVEVLRSGFDTGRCTDCSEKTLWGLQQFGYTDEHGCITPTGRLVVMERMSLEDQCSAIELPLEDFEVESIANPELSALNLFEQQGYIGACCDGGVMLTLLKSLCLDSLTRLSPTTSREAVCVQFLEAQLSILRKHHREILQSLRTASRETLVSNFCAIYRHLSVRERYPGLNGELMTGLYDALTVGPIAKVMRVLMRRWRSHSRMAMGSLGDMEYFRGDWPDLTLVREGEVRFVEVSTFEPLGVSQLMHMPEWREILPAKFSVVRIGSVA